MSIPLENSDLNVAEQVNVLFKSAMGFPSTKESTPWFQETAVKYNNYLNGEELLLDTIPSNPIWGSNKQPSEVNLDTSDFATGGYVRDDTTGTVREYKRVILTATPNSSDNSYYLLDSNGDNVLADGLQFNTKWSGVGDKIYPYTLNTQSQISADSNAPDELLQDSTGGNWLFDIKNGVLFFPDYSSSLCNNTTNKPVFSFYKYIGKKGISNLSVGGGSFMPTGEALTVSGNIYYDGGDVGIGTNNPQAKLDVIGDLYLRKDEVWQDENNHTEAANIYLDCNLSSSGTTNGLIWHAGSYSTNYATKTAAKIVFKPEGNGFSGGLDFYTNNFTNNNSATLKMRIKGDGNVGIGTTNPRQSYYWTSGSNAASAVTTLDVYGKIRFGNNSNNIMNSEIGGTYSNAGLFLACTAVNTGVGESYMLTPSMTTSSNYPSGFIVTGYNGGYTGLALGVLDTNTSAAQDYSTKITMLIKEGGNVGIGTDDPETKLHVNGKVYITVTDSDASGLIIKNTSSSAGDRDARITLDSKSSGEPAIYFKHDAVNKWIVSGGGDFLNGKFYIERSPESGVTGGYYFVIKDDGNVGIGTTSPYHKLEISDGLNYPYSSSHNHYKEIGAVLNINTSSWAGAIKIVGSHNTSVGVYDLYNTNSSTWTDNGRTDGATFNRWAHFSKFGDLYFRYYYDSGDTNNYRNVLFLKHDGNVAIGTTDPGAKLDINYGNHVSEGIIQTWKYYNGSIYRSLNLKCPTNNSNSSPFIFQTPNAMEFQCDSNIGVHIDEFGKVGIGKTPQYYELEVDGHMEATGSISSGTDMVSGRNLIVLGEMYGCNIRGMAAYASSSSNYKTITTNGYYRILKSANSSQRICFRCTIVELNSGKHSSTTFLYSHHYGSTPSFTLLNRSAHNDNSVTVLRYYHKGTYDETGIDIWLYATSKVKVFIDDNYQSGGIQIVDFEYNPSISGLTIEEISFRKYSFAVMNQHHSLFKNRVGIGLSPLIEPTYPLEVTGYKANVGYTAYMNSARFSTSDGSNHMCIFGDYGIATDYAFYITSDRRIKKNIVDVPDNLALQQVRNIPCRYYEYKDDVKRGPGKTIGFIAQEVKEILPMAVSLERNFIPNEMRLLDNISWEEIIDSSNNGYKLTCDLQDVSGVKYKFYVSNDPSGNDEIIKEVVGNSDNTFIFNKLWNNIFCYGKEVEDFHMVDKQKLFALNFSATQEIDRIQQQEKTKLIEMQTQLQTTQTQLQTTQTQLSEAQTKITNLEAALALLTERVSALENQ